MSFCNNLTKIICFTKGSETCSLSFNRAKFQSVSSQSLVHSRCVPNRSTEHSSNQSIEFFTWLLFKSLISTEDPVVQDSIKCGGCLDNGYRNGSGLQFA
ncbi:hypothetical protein RIF29_24761 [Crotalaria pallida]|uniref:Uncharacterized protein n=1 Tax=Crotalaria pallida TaxID=3830 RepID=A0AAN9HYQ7_CROPI